MNMRLPPLGESSVRRSTRTEGPSVENRSVYSCTVDGGIKRSRQVILTVDGGTMGRHGEEGTEELSAIE